MSRAALSRFRRRAVVTALSVSAIAAFSAAFVSTAVLLLVNKFAHIFMPVWAYIIAAVGTFAIVGGVVFIFSRPSDKTVARTLDERCGLEDRVSTMLACEGRSDVMAQMQRDDAAEKLEKVSPSKLGFGGILRYAIALVAAVIMLAVALFVPAVQPAAAIPPENEPFVLSELQRRTIVELIDDVNSSQLSEAVKMNTVRPLEGLLDEQTGLPAATTVGEMSSLVNGAIDDFTATLEDGLSYAVLSTAVGDYGLYHFVRALRRGAEAYTGVKLASSDDLQAFTRLKEELVGDIVLRHVLRYGDSVAALAGEESVDNGATSNAGEGNESPSAAEKQREKLSGDNISLAASLAATAGYDERDDLYSALASLSDEIKTIAEGDDADVMEALKPALRRASLLVSEALAPQTYRLGIERYLSVRLWTAFGMEIKPLLSRFDDGYEEMDADGGGTGDSGSGDDEGGSGGGYGGGGEIYGSDDLVFDPATGEYVPYGELLQRYYMIASERLGTDELNEEQKAAVRRYFDVLYRGFKEE